MALYAKTFACMALCAGLFGAVEAGQMHEQVKKKLERMLDEKFVGSIEAKRLTGSLVWGFTAHDVEVRDGLGNSVAHIDEFRVDASAYEMLRGDFRFDRAQLVRPVVYVERTDDDSTNIHEVFSSAHEESESSESRPDGSVVFEMTRAEVIDGEVVYVDASQPEGDLTAVASAKDLDASGTFRVLAGKSTETLIDELTADVVSRALPEPHKLSVRQARVETNEKTCQVRADEIAVEDTWRLAGFDLTRPRGADDSNEQDKLLEMRGHLTSDDAGSLRFDARLDADDRSFDVDLEADGFRPADWPRGPELSWLVVDGAGNVSGKGESKDDFDATVRWSAKDIAVGTEQLASLDLAARVRPQRVDIDELDVASKDYTASTTGHVSSDGRFSLDVDAHTNGPHLARRLSPSFGAKLSELGGLDWTTKARGVLDFEARGAVEMIERGKFDTTWKADALALDDLAFDNLRWKTAGGSLKLSLPITPRAERATRRVVYKASAAAHGLRGGELRAQILRATAHGDAKLSKRDAKLGKRDAKLGGDSVVEKLHYELESEAEHVRFGEHFATKGRVKLDGTLVPERSDDADWPIETLEARGTVDLLDYRSDEVWAKRVAANVDVRGEFPVGDGTIDVHTTGLRANGRRFRHSEINLELRPDEHFRLSSKSRVEVSLMPDLPLYLDVIGRHGRDLKAVSLDKFEVGRPGMRWKSKRPGLILFKDDALVVQSLTLYRLAQEVRLDGAYGGRGKGSLAAICNRLKNAQLRSFFDVGTMIEEKLHIKRTLKSIF